MPPKWYGKCLGAKGIDLDMVGAKPSLVILVFWLDFETWLCVRWKTKIMIFENWVYSILSNASKVMWKKFGSKRNWSWYGWCIAKCGDFGYILWLGGVWGEKRKSWFWKSGWTQTSQMPPKWCGKSLGGKEIDLCMVGSKPSLVILVFWLDFVTWWCVGWKTKIMIFENWVDSILSNDSKVMWKMFGSKRNWSWYGWCIAKFGDFVTW